MLYKIGDVVSIGKNYVILESNYKGEIVYVPRPKDFTVDKNVKVFIYEYKYDNVSSLYGFKTFKERILFEDLLTVPGIGPKTGIQILKESIKKILGLLLNGDAEGLSHLPGLGFKSAKQLIFELQDKYAKITANKNTQNSPDKNLHIASEIIPTLKTLGFSKKQINSSIHLIKPNKNIEFMVEEAIKIISNAKQEIAQTK